MLVLAIDPGNEESAWLVYDSAGENIVAFSKEDNSSLRSRIDVMMSNGRQRMFSHSPTEPAIAPDVLAIEMVQSFGMSVGQTVFETCVWIGRFIEAWEPAASNCVYRMEVKMHLCHSSRATDSNIRQALIDRFGPPGTKKAPGKTYGISADIWSALAIAVTYAETTKGANT